MQYDNSVVGFINDIAIVKDDNCKLFFTEVPAEHIAIGDFILEADLKPLSELDAETRKHIEKNFHRRNCNGRLSKKDPRTT